MKKYVWMGSLIVCLGVGLFFAPHFIRIGEAAPRKDFSASALSDAVWKRMNGVSYHKNDIVARGDLRYLSMPYYGFDGKKHRGEMVVHKKIAKKTLAVFKELYEEKYPIERMVLIDEYRGEDEASMADNNTCAFNYRTIQGTQKLSSHSMGMAIDLNPLYNPYVRSRKGKETVSPAEGKDYADRKAKNSHFIRKDDFCVKTFEKHGFSWGGNWKSVKDYQHFEYAGK